MDCVGEDHGKATLYNLTGCYSRSFYWELLSKMPRGRSCIYLKKQFLWFVLLPKCFHTRLSCRRTCSVWFSCKVATFPVSFVLFFFSVCVQCLQIVRHPGQVCLPFLVGARISEFFGSVGFGFLHFEVSCAFNIIRCRFIPLFVLGFLLFPFHSDGVHSFSFRGLSH